LVTNPWQNTGKCTSDSATQGLFNFCCQFVVKQYVAQNLFGFCCQFAVTLCTQALLAKHKLIADTDGTGFVTIFELDANLATIC